MRNAADADLRLALLLAADRVQARRLQPAGDPQARQRVRARLEDLRDRHEARGEAWTPATIRAASLAQLTVALSLAWEIDPMEALAAARRLRADEGDDRAREILGGWILDAKG